MHCIKLFSNADLFVRVRVFYDNILTEESHEVFDDNDVVDENEKTMCKTLKHEFYNKKVTKVDIQKQELNDAILRFDGILVQNFPGGQLFNFYSIYFFSQLDSISEITVVFRFLVSGVYEPYSLEPPTKHFVIGGCENISIAFDTPCCSGNKPCQLVRHSVEGIAIKVSNTYCP